MEKSVVGAAVILAVGMVVAAVIASSGMSKLGRSLEKAGSNAKSPISMPASLLLYGGSETMNPVRVQISEKTGGEHEET
jgi:enolase